MRYGFADEGIRVRHSERSLGGLYASVNAGQLQKLQNLPRYPSSIGKIHRAAGDRKVPCCTLLRDQFRSRSRASGGFHEDGT